jgi:Arsenate reductase and related proteins, glutaredoxin family
VIKHDFAKEPPSRELLDRLIDEKNLRDFLNTRSPIYKEMNLGERNLTKREAIDLMMKEPNLIRRPIVLSGRKAVFGFDSDRYDDILGS